MSFSGAEHGLLDDVKQASLLNGFCPHVPVGVRSQREQHLLRQVRVQVRALVLAVVVFAPD